jgi:hypothetical protein
VTRAAAVGLARLGGPPSSQETSISPSRMLAAAAMNPVAVSSMIVVCWSLSSW